MISSKKFTQYLIAFGMAFLVFTAVVISENMQFKISRTAQNPFEGAQKIEDIGTLQTQEKVQEVFTRDGELFIVFSHSKIELQDKTRKFIEGKMFFDASLGEQKTFQSFSPFILSQYTPQIGEIQVGPTIIRTWGALFVERDSSRSKTEIYAVTHSAEILFEGMQEPFVLPANHKVTLRDNFFSRKSKSSYSELKKEFQFSLFSLPKDPDPEMSLNEEKIVFSSEQTQKWGKSIQAFATVAPETWFRFHENEFTNSLNVFIENLQNNFAIGISSDLKNKRIFSRHLRPFLKAHFFLKNNRTALAQKSLEDFKKEINTPSWHQILGQNVFLNTQWNLFLKAHNVWLRTIIPRESEQIYIDFWLQNSPLPPSEKLEKLIFDAESFISFSVPHKAEEQFGQINTILPSFLPEQNGRFLVTKTRRILTEILHTEILLQKESLFRVYETLIEKEQELYKDVSFYEVRLEASRDILDFLKSFLEDKTKIEISRILIQAHKVLKIDELIAQTGDQLFSEEEKELIRLVTLIGNTGLTKEELESIKLAQENQTALDEKIRALEKQKQEQENENAPAIEDSGQIINAKHLKNVFTESGVETDSMDFKTKRSSGTTEFSNGFFLGKEVSGIFHYPTQFFKEIKIGDIIQEQLSIRFLEGFLNKFTSSPDETQKTIEAGNGDIFILQNTPQAILARKLVQDVLSLEGFGVTRNNIEVLDQTLTEFSITKASFNNTALQFTYNQKESLITQLQIGLNDQMCDFGSETFSFEEVKSIIEEKKQEQIERNKRR